MAKKQIGGQEMRDIAALVNKEVQGLGFALVVFQFNQPNIANYISNAQRGDMIKALEETVVRLKNNNDFVTPERN